MEALIRREKRRWNNVESSFEKVDSVICLGKVLMWLLFKHGIKVITSNTVSNDQKLDKFSDRGILSISLSIPDLLVDLKR